MAVKAVGCLDCGPMPEDVKEDLNLLAGTVEAIEMHPCIFDSLPVQPKRGCSHAVLYLGRVPRR